tara:strand:+ start:22 stop:579 length:558 start_codon:yes stop_codon:yes gene_type:complete
LSTKSNFSEASVKSYSRALYELSIEEKCLDEVEKDVINLKNLISQSTEFNMLINNPLTRNEDQIKVIDIIFEQFKLNNLFKKFSIFLIQKRRFFFIEKILKDFLILCSKKRGEISASIKVSKELNDEEITKIKKDLSENFGHKVNLNYKFDPTLIGGLIMQIESIMIDTSIKSKLKQIKNKLIEA